MTPDNLELIAIHIKKTAGMSFKLILKKAYARKYYRINIRPEIKNRVEVFDQRIAEMPEDMRVIHGHFWYPDAANLFEASPETPVVTWLRNPVDRLVSHYYYSKRKFEDGVQPDKTYLAHYSLMDYATDPRFINEMSCALKGAKLDELAFVGIMEYLNEDMAYLAAMLGWGNYEIPEQNTNVSYKSKFTAPTAEELEEIARLNQEDVELYQHALELRMHRPRLKKQR